MRQTFEQWLAKVDAACWRLAMCSHSDLADCCWRDWYEDGVSPASAAKRAIRAEMGE